MAPVTPCDTSPVLSVFHAAHGEELFQDSWSHQQGSDARSRLPTKGGVVELGDGWAGNKAGAALVSVPFSGVGRKGLPRINVTQWNEVFPRNVFYSQNSSSLSAN